MSLLQRTVRAYFPRGIGYERRVYLAVRHCKPEQRGKTDGFIARLTRNHRYNNIGRMESSRSSGAFKDRVGLMPKVRRCCLKRSSMLTTDKDKSANSSAVPKRRYSVKVGLAGVSIAVQKEQENGLLSKE